LISTSLFYKSRSDHQIYSLAIPSPFQQDLSEVEEISWTDVGAESEAHVLKVLQKRELESIAYSAQFHILTDQDLGFVVRLEKTREETEEVFISWYGSVPEWVERVQKGKIEGPKLVLKRVKTYKDAIYPIKRLENVELKGHGRVTVDIQKKADFELTDAIAHYYRVNEKEKVKELLSLYIQVTHRLWSLGLFEGPLLSPVNYGVDIVDGHFHVRLLDPGELSQDINFARQRIQQESPFQNSWAVLDQSHPKSVFNLADEEIARWFLKQLIEEITVEKLEQLWPDEKKAGSHDYSSAIKRLASSDAMAEGTRSEPFFLLQQKGVGINYWAGGRIDTGEENTLGIEAKSPWNSAEVKFSNPINVPGIGTHLEFEVKVSESPAKIRINLVDQGYLDAQQWHIPPKFVDVDVSTKDEWNRIRVDLTKLPGSATGADLSQLRAFSFEVGAVNNPGVLFQFRSPKLFTPKSGLQITNNPTAISL